MGKKKRIRKLTVAGVIEGDREQAFLDHLRSIYQPDQNNIALYPEHASGGNADSIVKKALIKCDRDRSFCWLDEDFEPDQPLSREIRELIAIKWCVPEAQKAAFYACPLKDLQLQYNQSNKNPILIVSQPVCADSLILKILERTLPYNQYDPAARKTQIDGLKNCLKQVLGNKKDADFYKENLPKEILEKKRTTIRELDLLISAITK